MILFDCPSKLKYFFQLLFQRYQVPKTHREHVKAAVVAILVYSGISMKVIGSCLASFCRNKSSISRMFGNLLFFTDELAWHSALLVCEKVFKRLTFKQRKGRWILLFDSTHRTRFGRLLKNLIGYSGTSSKKRTYAFVWALLIAPNGARITLPCPIWYTPRFAKEHNFARKTQPQLAARLVKYLSNRFKQYNLPIKMVVVADSAFDCKKLWKVCRNNNWIIVTSCDEARCLGSNDSQSSRIPGEKVHAKMATGNIVRKIFNPFALVGIAARSKQKSRPKKYGKTSHIYAYCQKQLRVAGAGTCKVVRSHKLRYYNQDENTAPMKVLICSDITMSARKIISYFSLRWEIELFFREQKSDLPFNEFQAHDFYACWKFVDLLCITFNFLEFFRLQLLDSPDYSVVDCHESLAWMRTSGLKELFRRHAFAETLEWLWQRSQTPFGIRRIKEALRTLKIPFDNFEFFQALRT